MSFFSFVDLIPYLLEKSCRISLTSGKKEKKSETLPKMMRSTLKLK